MLGYYGSSTNENFLFEKSIQTPIIRQTAYFILTN